MGRYAERGNVMFDGEGRTARWTGSVKAPGIQGRMKLPAIKLDFSPEAIAKIDFKAIAESFKKLRMEDFLSQPPPRLAVRTEEHDLFDGDERDVAQLADALWGGTWEVASISLDRGQKIAVLHQVSPEMREAIRERRILAQVGGKVELRSSQSTYSMFGGGWEYGPVFHYYTRHDDDMPTAVAVPAWAVPGARFSSKGATEKVAGYELLEVGPVMIKMRSVGSSHSYFAPSKVIFNWAIPTASSGR
jgi:hypothetical protein